MPVEKIFGSIADLPANVRSRMAPAEQRVFLRVFNRTFRATNGSQSRKESAAFRAANGVVRNMGKERERERDELVDGQARFEKRIEIEKVDEEQRMVWGWAYLCVDEAGQQVVDHSGDVVSLEDVHKAARDFMLESRTGGAMHDGRIGEVCESLVVTDAVAEELQIASLKRGWFIGLHVEDDEAWAGVKAGKFRAFSIGGTADTEELGDAGA